ncbi:MAG: DMT family transporter [Bacillota bacterium]
MAQPGGGPAGKTPVGAQALWPYLCLVSAPLFWSGNMIFGQVLAGAVPPITLSLVRWVVASMILALAVSLSEGRITRPARQAWGPVTIMAVTSVAAFTPLVYLSLHFVGSVEAALIQSSTPVFALLIARLTAGEGLTWGKAVGSLLTMLGVAVIVSRGHVFRLLAFHWDPGDLLMLLAALLWAVSTVAARHVAGRATPLSATFHSAWMGLLMLVPVAAWELARNPVVHLTPVAVSGIAYVSIFPSALAFLAWNYGVGRIGAGRAAVFNNLLPLFTAVWAVALLGEPVSWAQVVGGVLILGGVSLGGVLPPYSTRWPRLSTVGGTAERASRS